MQERLIRLRARFTKATALACRIRRDGITADQAEAAPESWWLAAATQAGVRPPSAATRALVVTMLREYREPTEREAFTGFGGR